MTTEGFAWGRRIANAEPGHVEGCEVQMVEKDGEEIVGICRCATGCPILQRSLDRGVELAEEHGW